MQSDIEGPLRKIIIIGNFGSGKSTLSKEIIESERLSHLDLDETTWQTGFFADRRMPLEQSLAKVNEFIDSNKREWVSLPTFSKLTLYFKIDISVRRFTPRKVRIQLMREQLPALDRNTCLLN